jgi:RNA polymerase sigma-70 factor (ECF subfamily)
MERSLGDGGRGLSMGDGQPTLAVFCAKIAIFPNSSHLVRVKVDEESQCTRGLVRIVATENAESMGPSGSAAVSIKPAEVFLAEAALLKKVIAGMGLRATDAEDVLQVVSVKCLDHPSAFAERSQCRRWLIRVTMNECVTEHRRRKRFRRPAAGMAEHGRGPAANDPAQDAVSSEQRDAVQGALRDLADELLQPLVLRYFCDQSSAEIGEILSLPASTVRSTLCKGRMALAKALTKRGIER